MRSRRIWLPVIGVLGPALWLAYELQPVSPAAVVRPVESEGRNVLAGTDPRGDDLAPLARMRWADVAITLDAIGRDSMARQRVIAETAGSSKAPVRYLRGLLFLAKGDAAGAAQTFAEIPAVEIPPEHLYAPYRVFVALGKPQENPFREPMRRAVAAGQASTIVAARVLGREGDLPGALQAFLRSNPEQWTSQDLELLEALRRHSGLAGEAITMLKAALKGGRVRESMRKPLVALVSVDGERVTAGQLQSRVAEIMRQDSPVRAPLIAAVERQLQMRERFLRRDYAGLIATYRPTDARNLPDETLLLLVLSSAQQSATAEFERWSGELRRRFPDRSVASWLQTLPPPPVL